MDRTAQISLFIAMLFIGLYANGQSGNNLKKRGLNAYPVYYLQGLEFDQDSSVIGLYGWVRSEDRMVVFNQDKNVVALIIDTLISLPEIELINIGKIDSRMIEESNIVADSVIRYKQLILDSIYYWDDYYDFDPDQIEVDSTESRDQFQGLSDDTFPVHEELKDSIAQVTESLVKDSLYEQIAGLSTLEPEAFGVETDTIGKIIEPSKPDITQSHIPITIQSHETDSNSVDLDSQKAPVLIKIDSDVLGKNSVSRPQLDSTNRRTIFVRSQEESRATKQASAKVHKDTLIIIEKTIEKPVEYIGLSNAERERQLRSDAENRRKIEAARLTIEEKESAARIESGKTVPETTAPELVGPKTTDSGIGNTDSGSLTSEPSRSEFKSRTEAYETVVRPVPILQDDTVVIVQRDTVTRKAVAELADLLIAKSRQDSQHHAEEKQRIDGRLDRIESRVDTLIDALGTKKAMSEEVLSNPKDEMNIYFSINSAKISSHQLQTLAAF
ncbi:MAG: hypothetical protein HKO93_07030, partial [Flavobacteriales bacterium]|nr:hypothetical protein [Flavobacteriales bacterium]